MKRYLVLSILFVLITPLCFLDAAEECKSSSEAYRYENLKRLSEIENDFRDAGWHYRRYQETLYHPLWQSLQLSLESYSPSRQAEGTVLAGRYRYEAVQRLAQARDELSHAVRLLSEIETMKLSGGACGEGPFEQCMAGWRGKFEQRLGDLHTLLQKYGEEQERLSAQIYKALEDTPSDHEAFGHRYAETTLRWDQKTLPLLFRIERDLRELLEQTWPAETCCASCAPDPSRQADPVLSQVRVDPEGTQGAGAGIVTHTALMEAFGLFDEETAAEKEKN